MYKKDLIRKLEELSYEEINSFVDKVLEKYNDEFFNYHMNIVYRIIFDGELSVMRCTKGTSTVNEYYGDAVCLGIIKSGQELGDFLNFDSVTDLDDYEGFIKFVGKEFECESDDIESIMEELKSYNYHGADLEKCYKKFNADGYEELLQTEINLELDSLRREIIDSIYDKKEEIIDNYDSTEEE